jgi:hypothetical protein
MGASCEYKSPIPVPEVYVSNYSVVDINHIMLLVSSQLVTKSGFKENAIRILYTSTAFFPGFASTLHEDVVTREIDPNLLSWLFTILYEQHS